MATDKNTLKSWFLTGLKPLQTQFHAWLDSYWHKDEAIPQSAVSNLTNTLAAKTENAQFNAHKTDETAHQALFDLKEDKTQKGVPGGYAPLDEFNRIAAGFLKIVDDLVTGGSDALLSAEQGKILKTQIDGINALLTSNDVNLDTVQEIVDAIKAVETSLSTILVNDLTTGGVTKALTAEMGKSLKALIDGLDTNKVDKVAGERLISAAEQTQLANLTTNLAAKQDIANQVEVSTTQDAQVAWHGKTVFFTANVTITIPAAGLPSGYTFEGVTNPGCSITWAITSPKTWVLGSPAATPEKSIFTLMQLMSNSDNIYLFGL